MITRTPANNPATMVANAKTFHAITKALVEAFHADQKAHAARGEQHKASDLLGALHVYVTFDAAIWVISEDWVTKAEAYSIAMEQMSLYANDGKIVLDDAKNYPHTRDAFLYCLAVMNNCIQ